MPPPGRRRGRRHVASLPVDAAAVAEPATITASADYPELYVEWAPDSGPKTAAPTWVPLTSVTWQGSTKRGRNRELDRFDAGTLTLTLRNATRLYDPENAAGAYYGKLLPMRQIRVRAKWAGTVRSVWRGYITTWGQTVPDDAMFVTQITAKDAFERLEQFKLPSSAWALEIQRDNPDAWFRLGESQTTRLSDSSHGGNYGVYDNCQQGAPGLVVNDSDGAVAFAHSLEERVVIQNPNLITGYPFTISGVFKIKSSPSTEKELITSLPLAPLADPHVIVRVLGSGSTGYLYADVEDVSGNARGSFSATPVEDNEPHHFMWSVTSASSQAMYSDGALSPFSNFNEGGTGAPSWPGSPPNGWVVGNYTDVGFGDYGFGANDVGQSLASIAEGGWYVIDERGTIDEICVWDGTAVAADRAAAHNAARLAWADDLTGTRVGRLLDAFDWPDDLRDIDAGISILGGASWSTGSSLLSVLQGLADTEYGLFFIGKSGEVVWRSRHASLLDLSSTRSQATWGDGHSSATLKYDNNGLAYDRDETLIRNPVIASRKNGITVTVRDDDLADNVYGDRSWLSPTTEDRDDASVRDRASYLLARFKEESTRVTGVTFAPRRDPNNLWPEVLDREIGDRVTIKRTPAGLDSETSLDQIVEGIEHTFSPLEWRTTFRCSPVDPNVGSYLILDEAGSLLDTALLAY